MTLPIALYGHPVLRRKGEPIDEVTPEIRSLIQDMLHTMREANGVGLAAQQIGRALQLTVVDVTGVEDRPSTLTLGGQTVDPETHMPVVLINPEITPFGERVSGPEGCLSFPEIYADIERPEGVEVRSLNEEGVTVSFKCGGLLARAIQHEFDHLQGILFIDRMTREAKDRWKPELDAMQAETKASLKHA
jgi:peptide deformylase